MTSVKVPYEYRDEERGIDVEQLRDDLALILEDFSITHPSFGNVDEELLEQLVSEFMKRVEVIE